jgi:DNA-binding transcriptional regulator GbsR (MarR family)
MNDQTRDATFEFVDAWGGMGALWGINRSVARVHALLLATEGTLSLDEIASRLQISKGNASMCLRELRSFGVVRLVQHPGDRRDHYVTEPDVWTMFFRILGERKRRELDPATTAIRGLIQAAGAKGVVHERLDALAGLLAMISTVAERLVRDPDAARAALALFTGLTTSDTARSN